MIDQEVINDHLQPFVFILHPRPSCGFVETKKIARAKIAREGEQNLFLQESNQRPFGRTT